jgi:transcription initiation factor IIE alpha subunit
MNKHKNNRKSSLAKKVSKKLKARPKPKFTASRNKPKINLKAPFKKPGMAKLHQAATALKPKHSVKEPQERKRTNVAVSQPDEVKESLDRLLSNEKAVEYLKKNVSKMAVDVIGMLVTPKTDEFLAEQLGTKINAIRRILNIMQGYGITNYYISKNTKGWLSFAWYINTSKLPPFLEYVEGMEREKSIVSEACNDYFICNDCYKSDRFVFTFDSAFENSFKCNSCGKSLNRMNREEAEGLISNKPAVVKTA